MNNTTTEQAYQFLKPYDLYRIQYTLSTLLIDYQRVFKHQGLPANMDMMLDDLGALFELLMELQDHREIVIHDQR